MFRSAAVRSGFLTRTSPYYSTGMRAYAGEVNAAGGAYAERERAVENKAARSRDAELLAKLRESLNLEEHEEIPENVVAKVVEEVKPLRADKIRKEKKTRKNLHPLKSIYTNILVCTTNVNLCCLHRYFLHCCSLRRCR